jgi:predicted enzyme related to lactoylglutathione lyase
MSSGQPSGTHTQVGFAVDDVDAEVADLKAQGVKFEEYDFPGLKTVDGIAQIEGERGAWFKDSEGNLLAISTETN